MLSPPCAHAQHTTPLFDVERNIYNFRPLSFEDKKPVQLWAAAGNAIAGGFASWSDELAEGFVKGMVAAGAAGEGDWEKAGEVYGQFADHLNASTFGALGIFKTIHEVVKAENACERCKAIVKGSVKQGIKGMQKAFKADYKAACSALALKVGGVCALRTGGVLSKICAPLGALSGGLCVNFFKRNAVISGGLKLIDDDASPETLLAMFIANGVCSKGNVSFAPCAEAQKALTTKCCTKKYPFCCTAMLKNGNCEQYSQVDVSRGSATDCRSAYQGIQNTTKDGNKCKYWSETKYNDNKEYKEMLGTFAPGKEQASNKIFADRMSHNFCRNPDGDSNGLWCIPEGKNDDHREYCEPKNTNTTISGKVCQKWSAQSPHTHNFNIGDHNKCANPNGNEGGAWCFTEAADTRWEGCSEESTYLTDWDLKEKTCCDVVQHPNCCNKYLVKNGTTASGKQAYMCRDGEADNESAINCTSFQNREFTTQTESGFACKNWASREVVRSHTYHAYNTDGKGLGDHNYCRNPNNDPKGMWCYSTHPDHFKEYCKTKTVYNQTNSSPQFAAGLNVCPVRTERNFYKEMARSAVVGVDKTFIPVKAEAVTNKFGYTKVYRIGIEDYNRISPKIRDDVTITDKLKKTVPRDSYALTGVTVRDNAINGMKRSNQEGEIGQIRRIDIGRKCKLTSTCNGSDYKFVDLHIGIGNGCDTEELTCERWFRVPDIPEIFIHTQIPRKADMPDGCFADTTDKRKGGNVHFESNHSTKADFEASVFKNDKDQFLDFLSNSWDSAKESFKEPIDILKGGIEAAREEAESAVQLNRMLDDDDVRVLFHTPTEHRATPTPRPKPADAVSTVTRNSSKPCSEKYPCIEIGTKKCDEDGKTECPLDCISEWGKWSECSQPCGGGYRFRVLSVFQQPKYGGKACPGPDLNVEKEACNTGSCENEKYISHQKDGTWQRHPVQKWNKPEYNYLRGSEYPIVMSSENLTKAELNTLCEQECKQYTGEYACTGYAIRPAGNVTVKASEPWDVSFGNEGLCLLAVNEKTKNDESLRKMRQLFIENGEYEQYEAYKRTTTTNFATLDVKTLRKFYLEAIKNNEDDAVTVATANETHEVGDGTIDPELFPRGVFGAPFGTTYLKSSSNNQVLVDNFNTAFTRCKGMCDTYNTVFKNNIENPGAVLHKMHRCAGFSIITQQPEGAWDRHVRTHRKSMPMPNGGAGHYYPETCDAWSEGLKDLSGGNFKGCETVTPQEKEDDEKPFKPVHNEDHRFVCRLSHFVEKPQTYWGVTNLNPVNSGNAIFRGDKNLPKINPATQNKLEFSFYTDNPHALDMEGQDFEDKDKMKGCDGCLHLAGTTGRECTTCIDDPDITKASCESQEGFKWVRKHKLDRCFNPSDCKDDAPIFVNAHEGCRHYENQSECPADTPYFSQDEFSGDGVTRVYGTKVCRKYEPSDCGRNGFPPVFVSPEKGCMRSKPGRCPADKPLFVSEAEGCRAYTPVDCGKPNADPYSSRTVFDVFVSGVEGCRGYTQADCGTGANKDLPLLKNEKEGCRAFTPEDCPFGKGFVGPVDGCGEMFSPSDCSPYEPFVNGLVGCQNPGLIYTPNDCTIESPVFVSNEKGCRPERADECGHPSLFIDGKCKPATKGQCHQWYALNGFHALNKFVWGDNDMGQQAAFAEFPKADWRDAFPNGVVTSYGTKRVFGDDTGTCLSPIEQMRHRKTCLNANNTERAGFKWDSGFCLNDNTSQNDLPDKFCERLGDETLKGSADRDYRGVQTKTRKGFTCQNWPESSPVHHSMIRPTRLSENRDRLYRDQNHSKGVREWAKWGLSPLGVNAYFNSDDMIHKISHANYCRNVPGSNRSTIWCFVKDGLRVKAGGSGYSIGDQVSILNSDQTPCTEWWNRAWRTCVNRDPTLKGEGKIEVTGVDAGGGITQFEVIEPLHRYTKWRDTSTSTAPIALVGGAELELQLWDYCDPLPQEEADKIRPGPIERNLRLKDDGKICREYNMKDCDADKPYLDSGLTGCRPAATPKECNDGQKFVSPAVGCRSMVAEDCEDPKLFVSGKMGCRKWMKHDCDHPSLFLGPDEGCCDEAKQPDGSYVGCQSKTTSGKTCASWNVTVSATLATTQDHNYCRDPDKRGNLWCHTMEARSETENVGRRLDISRGKFTPETCTVTCDKHDSGWFDAGGAKFKLDDQGGTLRYRIPKPAYAKVGKYYSKDYYQGEDYNKYRMFSASNNPGSTWPDRVENCASACAAFTSPDGRKAKGFFLKTDGRCYCSAVRADEGEKQTGSSYYSFDFTKFRTAFDGECGGKELRMYENSSDNPGTTRIGKTEACAKACLDKKTPLNHSKHASEWNSYIAKGFIVADNGRCYCESQDSASCSSTEPSYKFVTTRNKNGSNYQFTKAEATAECERHGQTLCPKEAVEQVTLCNHGWMSDHGRPGYNGAGGRGCGSKGWNYRWSSKGNAHCCVKGNFKPDHTSYVRYDLIPESEAVLGRGVHYTQVGDLHENWRGGQLGDNRYVTSIDECRDMCTRDEDCKAFSSKPRNNIQGYPIYDAGDSTTARKDPNWNVRCQLFSQDENIIAFQPAVVGSSIMKNREARFISRYRLADYNTAAGVSRQNVQCAWGEGGKVYAKNDDGAGDLYEAGGITAWSKSATNTCTPASFERAVSGTLPVAELKKNGDLYVQDVGTTKSVNPSRATTPISTTLQPSTDACRQQCVSEPGCKGFTVLPQPQSLLQCKTYDSMQSCDETIRGTGGDGYRGCQTKTKTGRTCQKWTDGVGQSSSNTDPHGHNVSAANYPNKGLGDHNYCRNPDGEPGIWCYTTDPDKRWELCDPVTGEQGLEIHTLVREPAQRQWVSSKRCIWNDGKRWSFVDKGSNELLFRNYLTSGTWYREPEGGTPHKAWPEREVCVPTQAHLASLPLSKSSNNCDVTADSLFDCNSEWWAPTGRPRYSGDKHCPAKCAYVRCAQHTYGDGDACSGNCEWSTRSSPVSNTDKRAVACCSKEPLPGYHNNKCSDTWVSSILLQGVGENKKQLIGDATYTEYVTDEQRQLGDYELFGDWYRNALVGGYCVADATFQEAKQICAKDGARLCTSEEVNRGCTLDSGCGANTRWIWSLGNPPNKTYTNSSPPADTNGYCVDEWDQMHRNTYNVSSGTEQCEPVVDVTAKWECKDPKLFVSRTEGCREYEEEDCEPNEKFVSGDAGCTPITQADCTLEQQTLDSATGICRPFVPDDCLQTEIFVSEKDGCTLKTQEHCKGQTPVFENGQCRPFNDTDCSSEQVFLGPTKGCRQKYTVSECAGKNQFFISPVLGCRPFAEGDCTGTNSPVFDADEGVCREYVPDDCKDTKTVFHSGKFGCRGLYQKVECDGDTPIFVSDTEGCRASYTQADCDGTETPKLESPTEGCRAYRETDCDTSAPVFKGPTKGCKQPSHMYKISSESENLAEPARSKITVNIERAGDTEFADEVNIAVANPCPATHPHLEKWGTSNSYWCYEGRGNAGGVCRMSNSGRWPPADGEWGANQTDCSLTGPAKNLVRPVFQTIRFSKNETTKTVDIPIKNKIDTASAVTVTLSSLGEKKPRRYTTIQAYVSGKPVCAASEVLKADETGCRERTQDDCGDSEVLKTDNTGCRTRTQADCTGTTKPKLDNGVCRALTQADCTGTTKPKLDADSKTCRLWDEVKDCAASKVLKTDNTGCRPRTQADCDGTNKPVLDATSKTCRALTQADCTGTTKPKLDNGVCRALTQADCTGTTKPKLDNGVCRALTQADCTGTTKPKLDNGVCRALTQADCTGTTKPKLDNGVCRALTQADCTGTTKPKLDADSKTCRLWDEVKDCAASKVLKTDNTGCRPRTQADCDGTNKPVLDATSKTCRARTQDDCDGTNKPILDNGNCRERTQADCTGTNKPILDNGNCRERTQADCTGTNKPILDNGNCRERTQADCTGTNKPILGKMSGLKLMSRTRKCRERTQADCTGTNKPILDNGNCRARMQADCTVLTKPKLDAVSKVCREWLETDCEDSEVFQSGTEGCAQAASCSGDTPVFDSVTEQCRALRTAQFVVQPAVAAKAAQPAGFKCITSNRHGGSKYDWYCNRYNCKSSCAAGWRGNYCRVTNEQVCNPTPATPATPAVTETRVSENLVNMDGKTMITKQVGGGHGHRWKSVHKATLPAPTVVSKINLSAQMKEQYRGNPSYGHVTAIGSYQGKRSWHKTVKHSKTNKPGRSSYITDATDGFEDVDFSRSPEQQIKCAHWGWTGGYNLPAGSDGGSQCGGVPTRGLTDKIEIWHQSRRGGGHTGYARNVAFQVQ